MVFWDKVKKTEVMNSGVVQIQLNSCYSIAFNRMQQKLNVMFKYFRV